MKFIALILTVHASVAQADCPNPDALAQGGIYASFEGGNFTHYRHDDNGLVIETEHTRRFGPTYHIVSHHGVYKTKEGPLLPSGEVSKVDFVLIEYGIPDNELPLPVAGLNWRGTNKLLYPESPFQNASESTREEMHLSVKEQTTLNLGGCSLTVLPFTIHYEWPEYQNTRIHEGYYLPNYGITIARVDPIGPVTAIAISDKRPAN